MKFLHIQRAMRGGYIDILVEGCWVVWICNCVTSVWGWLEGGGPGWDSGELIDTYVPSEICVVAFLHVLLVYASFIISERVLFNIRELAKALGCQWSLGGGGGGGQKK
jgi:hypothetical protein